MDSLTQIVLGAACGEAVAGKKLGNRAMLWGAVGGTIPDLDVFAALFTDQITSTSFHRGFMHSFLFAALMPWVLARAAQWFYDVGTHRRRGYKLGAMAVWLLFYVLAATGINFIPVALGEGLSWYVFTPTLLLGAWFARNLWVHYWKRDFAPVKAPYSTWVALFFWSIFTHPILDCFTNWGTQIWQPFSDERVQWTTVSVVDPIYTIPFALCLFIASRYGRALRARSVWAWIGIAWSCAYLAYTYWHKATVNNFFKEKLRTEQVAYSRSYTGPSIFNNIVWYAVAEGDTAYYYSTYGLNDCRPTEQVRLITIPKRHTLLQHIPPEDRAYRFIRWFSNGYYTVSPYNGDTLRIGDLRFGLIGDTLSRDQNFPVSFLLFKNRQQQWDVLQMRESQRDIEKFKGGMSVLWERIKGRPCPPQ